MVTAQIDMRRSLRELERQASIVDAIFGEDGVAMLVYGVDGRIERASNAMCALLQKDEAILCGQRNTSLIHPDDHAIIFAARDELLSGRKKTTTLQGRFLHADGSSIAAAGTASLIRDVAGAPRYFLFTLTESRPE